MWFNVFIVAALVILSGTLAGLTLALFKLKLSTLERKIRMGDARAKKIYKIRKNGNLLLCTLLLGNVASYTIMAIFLGSITSGFIAGIIATALIFIFGEILPQAIFPRYALDIGSRLYWLVWALLIIFYPVSAPVAWALDLILGKEPRELLSKRELGEVIRYHQDVGDGIIDRDEERIILGALSFSELSVKDIMIPRESTFYLESDKIIDRKLLEEIKRKGFSRIPVLNHEDHRIIGLLYAKNLIGLDFPNELKTEDLCSRDKLIFINENTYLDNLLNLLIAQKMHLAMVTNKAGYFKGVVSLEDVLEEILKIELEDLKE